MLAVDGLSTLKFELLWFDAWNMANMAKKTIQSTLAHCYKPHDL